MRPLGKGDPQQIGPFRIIGLLGGGGMGRVYLGRAADGQSVAVKTARAELADDPGFRKRFAREVAAAQRVGGPFVAPVVAAAPHDDVPWMATAYVPGLPLSTAVADAGPLPGPTVRLLAAGLLQALAAVHAHGLVHRDLKPSNILLTADGPRVIDFGIAHSAADTALTVTGTTMGTPGFMAPEQLTVSGPGITGAADVFALGGVLVFAATGSGPYGSAEPQVLMYRTVHEQPRLDGLPAGLREVAADCLAKEPAGRPDLPSLMARVGPPGPYGGDWLPDRLTVELERLSARLGDPRAPGAAFPPTPHQPQGPPPPHGIPTPSGSYGTPQFPAPYPPAAPTPPPAAPAAGPSRRRLLAALSVAGVAAGGGALAWTLRSTGGAAGPDPAAGRRPGGAATGAPAAQLPQALRDAGVLTIGSDLTYAPMESLSGDRPTGFDIDLGEALGRVLGLRVTFRNAAFDTLLTGLNAGRFQLVMSALTDTKERQEGRGDGAVTGAGVDLVDYFRSGLSLVVRKGNPSGIQGPGDLPGMTVAVQRGTAAHDYLQQLNRQPTAKVRPLAFASSAEVYAAVAADRAAVCLDEYPVAAHAAATRPGGDGLVLTGKQIDPVPFGIAVARKQPALRDAVRDALDQLIASGDYRTLLRRWNVEDGAVERAVVNGGG
ncbi:serine/threonine-protein kinase [Streptomyces sp. RS10V-4]|uniref:serine/threonine-protein kinase n=1 Tax=Streptomyces rhizoryzae TaxID=2932493 RepID=UPI002002C171|nr:serine/threonine-protein kinase [Streptomyces rhizoryzae]MCK7622590.1 serine/threonine-protein kinase [Streptomyces rhizoryzae]